MTVTRPKAVPKPDTSLGDVSSPLNMAIAPDGSIVVPGVTTLATFNKQGVAGTAFPQAVIPMDPVFSQPVNNVNTGLLLLIFSMDIVVSVGGGICYEAQLNIPGGGGLAVFNDGALGARLERQALMTGFGMSPSFPLTFFPPGNWTVDVFQNASTTATTSVAGCNVQGLIGVIG